MAKRKTPLLVGAGILLVAAISGIGAMGLGGDDGEGAKQQPRTGATVTVTRGTLTEKAVLDGELGYGPDVPFLVKAQGTITWLPAPGTTVERGEAVLRVDDRPVVLLYGALPVYRDLAVPEAAPEEAPDEAPDPTPAPPAELKGMDVKQFETNLAALGYTGFTVDDTYSDLTAHAVKQWQHDLALPETGTVKAGDILYTPTSIRTATATARPGAPAEGSPLGYTSTRRMVTIQAPPADLAWAHRGTHVDVQLPDGKKATGTIGTVGKEAAAPPEGEEKTDPEISVTVTFDDKADLGRIDEGPVTVQYTLKQREHVLTVPVAALVALAEGGHGLELADGESFVKATTGLFADGKVEVSGPGIHEGLKVRIPE
ncbi:hypothetical protein SRB5_62480 [Streptomyces sp. RB5]|uniref:Peptidoglycan binding-like domain-containing protein n=1 Tax=Streptomyces smaragdinus TaxID=2585196 RepID=A0A7K0CRD9_9ACTN|nr:peptidoglycan-binding domain-containing protein [Streptomyces smaragdinus]MQY16056.1 hypothetical protein [Streptomyces smaragdinus]